MNWIGTEHIPSGGFFDPGILSSADTTKPEFVILYRQDLGLIHLVRLSPETGSDSI